MNRVPAIVWPLLLMAALFGVSSIPGQMPGQEPQLVSGLFAWVPPGVQNTLHVPVYALLAWSWFRALPRRWPRPAILLAGIGLTLAYAVLDEWHQTFVPGRFASATDLAADALGAVLAAALYRARTPRDG